jgi:hypothetical protein
LIEALADGAKGHIRKPFTNDQGSAGWSNLAGLLTQRPRF